jgi:hypothetical protein
MLHGEQTGWELQSHFSAACASSLLQLKGVQTDSWKIRSGLQLNHDECKNIQQ